MGRPAAYGSVGGKAGETRQNERRVSEPAFTAHHSRRNQPNAFGPKVIAFRDDAPTRTKSDQPGFGGRFPTYPEANVGNLQARGAEIVVLRENLFGLGRHYRDSSRWGSKLMNEVLPYY